MQAYDPELCVQFHGPMTHPTIQNSATVMLGWLFQGQHVSRKTATGKKSNSAKSREPMEFGYSGHHCIQHTASWNRRCLSVSDGSWVRLDMFGEESLSKTTSARPAETAADIDRFGSGSYISKNKSTRRSNLFGAWHELAWKLNARLVVVIEIAFSDGLSGQMR